MDFNNPATWLHDWKILGADDMDHLDGVTTQGRRPVDVELGPALVALLRAEAAARHGDMRDRDLPYGRPSNLKTQFVGVLGEAGLLAWLSDEVDRLALGDALLLGPRPAGSDTYLNIREDGQGWTSMDVKSHDPDFWGENGRLVNQAQLARMSADVLFWCVVPPVHITPRVTLMGWSPVDEVRTSGVPAWTRTGRNVRATARLRPPQALSTWIESGRPRPFPP